MKYLDRSSLIVMIVTVGLFAVAAFRHGLTDQLLAETGIFLVSVKLVLLSYSNGQHIETVEAQLATIREGIERIAGADRAPGA